LLAAALYQGHPNRNDKLWNIVSIERYIRHINEIDIQGKKLIRKLINMLEFLIDNIFVIFGGSVFSTDSRHTYGYKLGSSSRRLVPLFV
jgi:hypothetical protein